MPLWFAALYGLVQGVTEFLPVSSTAHLRLLAPLLGQPDAGAAFAAVVQLGTLAAVVAYFARDLLRLGAAAATRPRSPAARLAWLLVLGTVPIGLAGLLARPLVEGPLRSPWVIAGALAALAVVFLLVERRPAGARTVAEITVRDALLIGCAQALALVPGTSRSGATIVVGLLLGLRRPDAARFSFLLSIPAVAAAGLFELGEVSLGGEAALPLVLATLVAVASGYAAVAWLLGYLGRRTLRPFAVYRLALAVILVALLAGHVLTP